MKRNKLILCFEYLLLLAFSLAGNFFAVPLFFGADLLFGSIGTFLVFFRFGLLPALPVALLSSLCTLFLWNHPFAVIIFVLELLVTALLFKKITVHIVFINMGFWAFIGIPLVFVFYRLVMDISLVSLVFVALKQCANGILNILIAYVIFNFVFNQLQNNEPRDKIRRYRVRDLLFVLFILFLSVPITILIYIFGKNEFQHIEKEIVDSLNRDSSELATGIDDWIYNKVNGISLLSGVLQKKDAHDSEKLQEILELTLGQNPEFQSIYVVDENGRTIGFYPELGESGESSVGLDFFDRDFFNKLRDTVEPLVCDVYPKKGGGSEPMVPICAPIINNDEFRGFVFGLLKLDYLNTLLKRLHNSTTIDRILVDKKKNIIASTLDQENLSHYIPRNYWLLNEMNDNIFHGYQRGYEKLSSMEKWNNSIYFRMIPVGYRGSWSLIVEKPAGAYIFRLTGFYIIGFSIMLGLIILSIVIALFVSKKLLRPIMVLQQVTVNLTEEIQDNQTISWPETGMIEVAELIENFKKTSSSLKVTMHILRESKDILEIRVKERTQELISANEELVKENEERKKLEQLLRLQERAIQSTEEGIVITDSIENDCSVIFINKSYEKITGYALEELIGNNLRILHGKDTNPETILAISKALKDKEAITVEILNYKKNGESFWNLLNISPIFDQENRVSHYIGVTQNINSRKEYEFDLKLAKEQAEEANRAKSYFLSNISHEIRTPMNHIVYMLGFLEATELNQEQLSYVQRLKDSSHLLMLLINDVLDLSRIESGKLVLESIPFKLNKMMKEITDIIEDLCFSKSIYLIYKKDPSVEDHFIGDPHRLKQVLMNLLSNAVKFTHTGGIRIYIEAGKKTPDFQEIIIKIIDTGIGISNEKKSVIFERFTQVDSSTTRKYGGTGIGLSICKSFIEVMSGEIVIDDNPEGGSVFIVKLPLMIAKPEFWDKEGIETLQSNTADHSPFLNGYKFLLVEDDELNRVILHKILEPFGVQVTEALDGYDAIQKYKESSYDLVLMDIQMPGLDGYSAVKEIRKIEKSENKKATPIIALTALAFETEIAKSIEAGMNGHVSKPISLPLLLDKIKEALNLKQDLKPGNSLIEEGNRDNLSKELGSMRMVVVDKVLEKINHDYSLYIRLIKLFIKQYSPMTEKDYFREMEIDKVRKIVHTLIPSAYNVGAFEFYDYLKQIYKKMNAQDEGVHINVFSISLQLSDLVPELQKIVDIFEKKMAVMEYFGYETEPKPQDMKSEIIALQKKLRVNDFTAVKTARLLLARLENNFKFIDHKLLEQIREDIEDLDFPKAEDGFSEILGKFNPR
ncbi:MAG: response regulator [Spirochaetales bacterium]|nr:response regulator [Spirochaetales bacterium]